MEVKQPKFGDDLEGWAEIADGLCRLKMASEYAHQFKQKFCKYMSEKDRVELSGLTTKFDTLYLKYWEKLVKKIRGLT